jgi:hypothetical protein
MFEELAAHIPTDSLARLYVAALDAPSARAGVYQNAIACQYFRMIWQYGTVAPPKAIRRMEDSLFTTPATSQRWTEAQRRWPDSLARGFPCDASDLRRAPDSLRIAPRKTIGP